MLPLYDKNIFMKFETPVSAGWIASFINAKIIGDPAFEVTGINEIHKVEKGDISFVDLEKYYNKSLQSDATVIIIDKEVPCPEGKILLVADDPFSGYVSLVKHFHPFKPSNRMIAETAAIGEGTVIQPGVFIGEEVRIGNNCIIHPNVTIYDHTVIEDHVIIHAGTVLGSDGFYFKKRGDRELVHDKLESCGRVVIREQVEIGAGCTIDRGVSGDTIIGAGSKLDNAVHVGHDTVIGKNCLFAAQVGIGGAAVIEDNVTLWGQVGVSKDLVIESNTVVLAQTGVPSSLKGGKIYFGYPAEEARYKRRELAWVKRIPEIWEKVKNL